MDDLVAKLKSSASRYGITGVDRGTPTFRAGKNLRYFWDEFQKGDYCIIPSGMHEHWNSAKASAYLYGKRHGGRFRSAAGSYLIIWCAEACETVSRLPDIDADHAQFIKERLDNCRCIIDSRGDISLVDGTKLQNARDDAHARKLFLLYALTGAESPQDYRL